MLTIQWNASGLFSWLHRTPQASIDSQIATVVREEQEGVFRDYMLGRLTPGFPDRLKPSAFGIYGLTQRSEKYQKRQMKALGQVTPYFSPRSSDYGKIAIALVKKKPNINALLSAIRRQAKGNVHMRDLLRIPVAGFSLSPSGTRKEVRTVLRLPGARVLNQGGHQTEIYRRELLDLSLGGNRDALAITAALNTRIRARLNEMFGSAPSIPFSIAA